MPHSLKPIVKGDPKDDSSGYSDPDARVERLRRAIGSATISI